MEEAELIGMLPLFVLTVVLLTSILSGIVGMAGGMILMALLVALYSVPVAMILHGVTQAGANGSRAWYLRRHIRWRVLLPYLAGSGSCVALFAAVRIVPDRGLVLLMIGLMPWLALFVPARIAFVIERRSVAFSCGLSVTAAQLLAGASGPLLDLFFQRSPLDRHQIVATKAITQTVGHLTKLLYYGGLLLVAGEPLLREGEAPLWLFLLVVPMAIVGTRVGTRVLDRLDETLFRRISSQVILALGAACLIAGAIELLL